MKSNNKTRDKSTEAIALLKILSMSSKNIRQSNAKGIKETFSDIRREIGILGRNNSKI